MWDGRFVAVRRTVAEKACYEVGASYPVQGGGNLAAIFGVVPEEEHALPLFLVGICGAEYFLPGVWVYARIVYLGGHCHGRGREILHLFEVEIE